MGARTGFLLMAAMFITACQDLTTEPESIPAAFAASGDEDSWIVWEQETKEWGPRTVMMHPDGSGFFVVALPLPEPALSPDRTKLAYTYNGHVRILGLWGLPGTQIVSNVPNPSDPTWSPDGGTIAYVSGGNIWARSLDGSPEVRLPRGPYSAWDPDWSPDGTMIVYVSGDRLWVTKLATGQSRQITTHRSREPAWSPDGKWIAYSTDAFRPWLGEWDIARVSVSGHSLVKVTTGLYSYRSPTWSPDGTEIVMSGSTGLGSSQWNLMKVPTSGGPGVILPNSIGADFAPHWR